MSKFKVTYELELDCGDIPPPAMAEYLLRAETITSDWNIWELAGSGEIRVTNVEVWKNENQS